MIGLKNTFELCIIQSLEISKTKYLLFDKIIELTLFNVDGTFFISNVLQEYIYKADVVAQFCSDHSPILLALDMIREGQMGKGLWKLKNSVLSNTKFVFHMTNPLAATIIFLNEENIYVDQIRFEHVNTKSLYPLFCI